MAKSTCSLSSTISSSSSSSSSMGSPASAKVELHSPCSVGSSCSEQRLGLKSTCSAIDRRKRLAANARERKRMHLLNRAYDQLRQKLIDAENKSKYDVLVQAKEYIQALASICEKFDQKNANQTEQQQQPLNHIPQAANLKKNLISSSPAPLESNHFAQPVVDQKPTPLDLLHYQQQQQQHLAR